MIYQSQSGDAADGTSTFSMTGGTLNNYKRHVFHVTNTTAIINLDGVTINDSGDGVLLSVCGDGWSGASNIATLNAESQQLTGDILVGSDSTLTLNISDSSTFTGNISGSITNAKGSKISTSGGTANVTLDDTSKWFLTGDTYISSFDGTLHSLRQQFGFGRHERKRFLLDDFNYHQQHIGRRHDRLRHLICRRFGSGKNREDNRKFS